MNIKNDIFDKLTEFHITMLLVKEDGAKFGDIFESSCVT